MLEREPFLDVLAAALAESVRGQGRLVLVAGEAGVGKTALVRRFAADARSHVRLLEGMCDALLTPRPLAPVADVAEQTGGALAELVGRGARAYEVLAVILDELKREPTLLVLEDLHWADEATFDLLRLLGRRVESTRSLIVATYREDEPVVPLRALVGGLVALAPVTRVHLPPLSLAAVRELGAASEVDGDELFRCTGGNAFFVTEAIAAGGVDLPPTVRDAVLARAARLDAPARSVLDAVAVCPPRAELWLLDELANADAGLDTCLASGMLVADGDGVAFRHELARIAIEEAIGVARSRNLHRRAVHALKGRRANVARLAHHAEAAADGDAAVEFASLAAAEAAASGAHREASAQYARALRFADGLPTSERAALLRLGAHESHLSDRYKLAVEWLETEVAVHRGDGDAVGEGDALRRLAWVARCGGRRDVSEAAARRAVQLLEAVPPCGERAFAYASMAMLSLNAEDYKDAIAWGERAVRFAEELGERAALTHALNTQGAAELLDGNASGIEKLERSLVLARELDLEEDIGRAYIHFGAVASYMRDYAIADRHMDAALEYCAERGLDLWLRYVQIYQARVELDRGRWDAAAAAIPESVADPGTPLPRILALIVLGLLRARRADPGQWEALDEALALARDAGELQFLGPVAAARAEARWLGGEHARAAAETDEALSLAVALRSARCATELSAWRRRCGIVEEAPLTPAGPFALDAQGRWQEAAEHWAAIGCPYEAALALAELDDEAALERARAELEELGAKGAVAVVARRLRARGAHVSRGPRRTTMQNAAGVTTRELDVLVLVADGLRNAEIAERLFLSRRTVDHHVSAILRKLGVSTRGQASSAAVRLGLIEDR